MDKKLVQMSPLAWKPDSSHYPSHSEGDWSVTLLREQQDGERHSGGLKGRSTVSPELGAKAEGLVCLLET